jgi:hypothetical protein
MKILPLVSLPYYYTIQLGRYKEQATDGYEPPRIVRSRISNKQGETTIEELLAYTEVPASLDRRY